MARKTKTIYSGETLHAAQMEVFTDGHRFRVVNMGRKVGKSSLCRAEILDSIGKGEWVAYACPTFGMLSEMWRSVKNTLEPIKKDSSETEHRFETINGGVLRMFSMDNPDGMRPFEFDKVILDEARYIPNLLEVFNSVVLPTLFKRHGRALIASTPAGFDGFFDLFQLGQDALNTEWMSWKRPTWDNPHLPESEINDLRRTMPANIFAQEVEAEFISDAGAVFRNLTEAQTAYWQNKPVHGHTYVIGVDLAKTSDFSVFTVFDVTIQAVAHIDRANHVNYDLQLTRLVTLYDWFHATGAVIEENTNLSFMEQLMKTHMRIIPFTTGGGTKAFIIEALAAAFDNALIDILNEEYDLSIEGTRLTPEQRQSIAVFLNELRGFAMERLPGGQMKYGAQGHRHDDCVMSFALAYYGATQGVPLWMPELIEIPVWGGSENLFPELEPELALPLYVPDELVPWPTAAWTYQS